MASKNAMMIVFISGCIHFGVAQLSTAVDTWTTNCFRDTQSGRCEDSSIKICSDYYLCDMVTETRAPPKRIGYINGNILAAVGPQTFIIRNGSVDPTNARTFIPPWDEFSDYRDNRYYAAEGTTYMADKETKKEIEIVTTGEYSFNQLAFDKETNQLFILSFSTNADTNERAGSLFAININRMNVENDKAQAERVAAVGDAITALAVEGGMDRLLLGMKTSRGGKVIRLTKQKGNPCAASGDRRVAVLNIFEEAREKLIKIFDDVIVAPTPRSPLFAGIGRTPPKDLELENIKLKRELHITTSRLTYFTSKLFSFNSNLKSIQIERVVTSTFNPNTWFTAIPEYERPPPGLAGPEGHNSWPKLETENEHHGCVSQEVFNRLNRRFFESESLNNDLKEQLAGLASFVDNMLMEVDEQNNTTMFES